MVPSKWSKFFGWYDICFFWLTLIDNKLRLATEKDFEVVNSLRKDISWDIYNVEDNGDYEIVGFWVKTKAKEESVAEIVWDLPKIKGIMIDKQPGIEGFDLKIDWQGKNIFEGELDNRRVFWLN